MALDELHLVREQGESLRPELKKAGNEVIPEVIPEVKKVSLKTPLVLFLATCQMADLVVIESACSIKITQISWATPEAMQKCGIKASLTCRSTCSSVAKQLIGPLMDDPVKKVVACASFQPQVEKIANALRGIAASHDNCNFDCLEIAGNNPSEQKSFNTNVFCGNLTDKKEKEAAEICRGLVATSSCASAGLDPPNVEAAPRSGCPPSLATVLQELGCLNCGEATPGWSYMCHMMVDVNSYAKLLWLTVSSKVAA